MQYKALVLGDLKPRTNKQRLVSFSHIFLCICPMTEVTCL